MIIEARNQFILSLEDSHPAKKFFIAFCECRDNFVGRQHDWTEEEPIEQAWVSADGREWLYSDFVYAYLSLSLTLTGCVQNSALLSDDEIWIAERFLVMRTLLKECCFAAERDKNVEILKLATQILVMLDLGEEYIKFRKQGTSPAPN